MMTEPRRGLTPFQLRPADVDGQTSDPRRPDRPEQLSTALDRRAPPKPHLIVSPERTASAPSVLVRRPQAREFIALSKRQDKLRRRSHRRFEGSEVIGLHADRFGHERTLPPI